MDYTKQSPTSSNSKSNDFPKNNIQNDNTNDDDDKNKTAPTRSNDSMSQLNFKFSESSLELSFSTETTLNKSLSNQIITPPKAVTASPSPSSAATTTYPTPLPSLATTSREPSSTPILPTYEALTSVIDSNFTTSTSNPQSCESLPKYSAVVKDMPPNYNNHWVMDIDPFALLGPIQPQAPWPITKRFYVYGFLMWPLWMIGASWIFTKDKNKRIWARRCALNALVVLAILTYVIVAAVKTSGRFE